MPAEYLDKLKVGFDFGLQQAGTNPRVLGSTQKLLIPPKVNHSRKSEESRGGG